MRNPVQTKGSALGSYVHLYWRHYEQYGTRSISPHARTQTLNDNRQAFINYQQTIRQRVRIMPKLQKQLNKAAEDFNTSRQNIIDTMATLDASDKTRQALFERVVANADLGKDVDISLVASMLDFDFTSGSINIATEETLKKFLNEYKPIHIATSKDQQYRRISTLRKRLGTVNNLVNSLLDPALKQTLSTECERMDTIIEDLEKNGMQAEEALSLLSAEERSAITSKDFTQKQVSVSVGQKILAAIKNIETAAIAGDWLAKLRGSFEEIIGTIVQQQINILVPEALSEMLVLGSVKSTMGLDSSMQISLNTDALRQAYGEKGFNQRINNQQTFLKHSLTDTLDLRFQVNYPTKDKVDFSLSLEDRNVGVSAKAVQLQKDWFFNKGKAIPGSISLQKGTSLYVYLMAFQRDQQHLGNHFLNVLAEHEDLNNTNLLRNLANDTLLMAMLYSALTGDITKPNNQLAEILYIYDTSASLSDGSPRVHFISIRELLIDLFNKQQNLKDALVVNPTNFQTATLTNKAIKGEDNKTALMQRLTILLVDARKMKFDIAVKHSYIREYTATNT